VHRAELSRYITHRAPFEQAYDTLYGIMSHHSGPRQAMQRAYALIQSGLNQQSILYSYVDDLRYMALVCFLCIPLVFLFKRVKKKPKAMAAH